MPPGGRNTALNHAALILGRWNGAGALEQAEVEDALYAAAERSGLIADDGARQTWAKGGDGGLECLRRADYSRRRCRTERPKEE